MADNVGGVRSDVGRGHGGQGVRGQGRGRGQGQRGHGRGGNGRGGVRNRVPLNDRQRLVDAYEAGDDYLDLAQRIGINYNTARSIIRVWLRDGRVEVQQQGGAHNVVVTAEMDDSIRDIALAEPFTTLTNIQQRLLLQFPDTPVSVSTIARHLDGHCISTKIAGKDADVPFERNRQATIERRGLYAQWLAELGINERLIYIDESGYNVYTRRTKGRALVGERVRREACPRGRNMIVILAINQEMGLVHHRLGQFTVTRDVFQDFVNNLIAQTVDLFPGEDTIHIVYDGARPHLNIAIPEQHHGRFVLHMLPPYSPFLNPVEQAHSCFKAGVKNELARLEVQLELVDDTARRAAGQTQQQWRSNILLRIGQNCLALVTRAKCAAWCGRVHRYIPMAIARQQIVD